MKEMMIRKSLKIIFIVLIISILNAFGQCLTISKGPNDQYVHLNSHVEFECEIEDFNTETDLVEWCKNDFCTWGRAIETFDGRLVYKSLPRYSLIINRSLGQWNLLIENITERDIGQFKCIATRRNETTVIKIESKSANLRIMGKFFFKVN